MQVCSRVLFACLLQLFIFDLFCMMFIVNPFVFILTQQLDLSQSSRHRPRRTPAIWATWWNIAMATPRPRGAASASWTATPSRSASRLLRSATRCGIDLLFVMSRNIHQCGWTRWPPWRSGRRSWAWRTRSRTWSQRAHAPGPPL